MTSNELSAFERPSKLDAAGIRAVGAAVWTAASGACPDGASGPRRGICRFSGASARALGATGAIVRSGRETSFFSERTTVFCGLESGGFSPLAGGLPCPPFFAIAISGTATSTPPHTTATNDSLRLNLT